MNAKEYGKAKRSHWQIENALHWVLDIAYREDESRVHAGKRKNCGWDHEYLLKVLKTLDVKKGEN